MSTSSSPPDHRFGVVMALSAAETAASVLVGRGVYFYTSDKLGFTATQNLLIALAAGVLYVIAAASSHALARRFGERRMLMLSVVTQIVCFSAMFLWPTWPLVIVAGKCVADGSGGLKWPIVESYAVAGRTPRQAARAVSLFNLVWSPLMIPAVFASGPMIAWLGPKFFLTGACLSLPSLWLIAMLRDRPVHLADDHPERPDERALLRFRSLLTSSRWSLFAAYLFLQVLVPLFPSIFKALGYGLIAATALASLLEVGRFAAFLTLHFTQAWHGRRDILALAALGIPLTFFVTLLGRHTGVVVPAEILLGVFDGLAYGAALYYAMVIKNASVDAGGVHESLIGAGFTIGPVLGLVGQRLAEATDPATGMVLGIGPTAALCVAMGLKPLMSKPAEEAPPA